jgi:hypothetical protein
MNGIVVGIQASRRYMQRERRQVYPITAVKLRLQPRTSDVLTKEAFTFTTATSSLP